MIPLSPEEEGILLLEEMEVRDCELELEDLSLRDMGEVRVGVNIFRELELREARESSKGKEEGELKSATLESLTLDVQWSRMSSKICGTRPCSSQ